MQSDDIDYVLNILRQGTITWSGRSRCLQNARKKVWDGTYFKNGKKKFKFQWHCPHCQEWFLNQEDMEVDHKVEIGPFTGDWNEYIAKMYCDPIKDLQALCIKCHSLKTARYNASRMRRESVTSESLQEEISD